MIGPAVLVETDYGALLAARTTLHETAFELNRAARPADNVDAAAMTRCAVQCETAAAAIVTTLITAAVYLHDHEASALLNRVNGTS